MRVAGLSLTVVTGLLLSSSLIFAKGAASDVVPPDVVDADAEFDAESTVCYVETVLTSTIASDVVDAVDADAEFDDESLDCYVTACFSFEDAAKCEDQCPSICQQYGDLNGGCTFPTPECSIHPACICCRR
jgi:hypothetical protein